MKLLNSRGRVLLHVESATYQGMDEQGLFGVQYQYTGDKCMGNVDIVGLQRLIECIKLDSPSAHVVGTLPEPKLYINKP